MWVGDMVLQPIFSRFPGDRRPKVTFLEIQGIWGLSKGKKHDHKMAVAHTGLVGFLNDMLAWVCPSELASVRRLMPGGNNSEGEEGMGTLRKKGI